MAEKPARFPPAAGPWPARRRPSRRCSPRPPLLQGLAPEPSRDNARASADADPRDPRHADARTKAVAAGPRHADAAAPMRIAWTITSIGRAMTSIGRAVTSGIAAAVPGGPSIATAPTGSTVTPTGAPTGAAAPTWAPARAAATAQAAATATHEDWLIANHGRKCDAAAARRAAAAAPAGPSDWGAPTASPTRSSPAIRARGCGQ